jgi:hypothetical protein
MMTEEMEVPVVVPLGQQDLLERESLVKEIMVVQDERYRPQPAILAAVVVVHQLLVVQPAELSVVLEAQEQHLPLPVRQ